MKIFKILTITLILLYMLLGCSNKTEQLCPTSSQVQIVEKKVIAGCPTEHITCDFSGDNFVPTQKLLECVKLQKYVIEQCQKVTPPGE